MDMDKNRDVPIITNPNNRYRCVLCDEPKNVPDGWTEAELLAHAYRAHVLLERSR